MKRIIMMLLLVAVFMATLPLSIARAEEPVSCSETDLNFEVTLEYVYEAFGLTTDTVVIRFGRRIIGGYVVIDVEYLSGSGEITLAQQSIELNNDCAPDFGSNLPGWDCTVAVTQKVIDEVLAEGDFVVVVLTYDQWVESLGPLSFEHNEVELWTMYVEYVVNLTGTLTTSTQTCTPPYTPGWTPGSREVILFQVTPEALKANPDWVGTNVDIYWVSGGVKTHINTVPLTAMTLDWGAEAFAPDPNLGVWFANDSVQNQEQGFKGSKMVEVWKGENLIYRAIISACEVHTPCEAQAYWVGGDNVNFRPRPSTIVWEAWQ